MKTTLRTLDLAQIRGPDHPGVDVHRIPRHGETTPHDHLFHELVVVEAGTAIHETARGRDALRAGDVIVICPRVWHAYRRPNRFAIINCLIDTRLIRRFAATLSLAPGMWRLLRPPFDPQRDGPLVLHADRVQRDAMTQRIDAIMAEQRDRRDGWQAQVALMSIELLVLTARLWRGGESAVNADREDRVESALRDAVSYVEAHYNHPIRLDDLAQRVHLSAGYLSRCFSQRMGTGVVDFVHRLRAEEACRWLASSQRPIKQIAAEVGYDEIAYFSRCFRRQIGLSPREYRRQRQSKSKGN